MMKEPISTKALWNEAGKAGLVLGAVSVVYTIIVSLLAKLSGGVGVAFLLSLFKFLLWAGKFVGCIFLMKFFLQALVNKYDGVDNKRTFHYGMAIAALSALIVAAYSLAESLFISPEQMQEAMDTALSSLSSTLDSNSMAIMDSMMNNLPQISFFSNLIYCFLFGTILSAILSRNIPSRDPFFNTPSSGENGTQQ